MSTMTQWGEALDPNNVLPEYPRPQLVRDSYLNLNGYWDFTITTDNQIPIVFEHRIVVPFSPESVLSGVSQTLLPTQFAWYRTSIQLDEVPAAPDSVPSDIVVNFGAVDQHATVYVNGQEHCTHRGGYLPFSVVIDPTLYPSGSVELLVRVSDPTDSAQETRGKQKTERGGIWYTPQSGIWQPVWAERVPKNGVAAIDYAYDIAASQIKVTVSTRTSEARQVLKVTATGADGTRCEQHGTSNETVTLQLTNAQLWSPENPHLYSITVELDGVETITSYCGMREFSITTDADGHPRLTLNGKPYFQAGILDQGYWPDGLYTASSDEAFIWDLELMKSMGFNMVRKHIKVEPLRFYYHCDRLGLLVWQDMINGGSHYSPRVITLPVALPIKRADNTERAYRTFGRDNKEARENFEIELLELIEHLRSVVSICLWVPFNEGWGQFDSARIAGLVKETDPTRIVDHASGWYDQKAGDVRSLHIYFKKFRMPRPDRTGRPLVLSEYGGYNYSIPGTHTTEKTFGYRKITSPAKLAEEFARLHRDQILPAVRKGLSATVYTQLSDVEDEMNGLASYDRRHVKIAPGFVQALNQEIRNSLPE